MKYILFYLSLFLLVGCGKSALKQKEMELKRKEVLLKNKEMKLKLMEVELQHRIEAAEEAEEYLRKQAELLHE